MTDSNILRKRLYFQSTHRGTKENDLMLTRFADRHLPSMAEDGLRLYDRFLNEQDPDIYAWLVMGAGGYPLQYQALIELIRAANEH